MEAVIEPELAGEFRDIAVLVCREERDPDACSTGATGPADAVDVGLAVGGRVEVDHVRDPLHVDPARRDVGRDERVDGAGLEAGERLLALALRFVAVHRHRRDAVGCEPFDEPVGAALGADEHEREVAVATELADERLDPVLVSDLHEPVLDLRVRAPLPGAVLMGRRVVRVPFGESSGLAVEGGREEQRLSLLRAGGDDPVDRRAKAHVEHPIGLIEDQHPDPVQSERAAREEVLEPAWGRDQHVRCGGVLGLLDQAGPAVDRGHAQRPSVRDPADLIDDLGRELAGWREHKRRRTRVGGADPVDQRDSERERLARPGRRLCDHIPAGHRVADHGTLDRERPGDSRC
ncbi:MAG TPA: hypothetical protein VED41_03210 [Solirubrobacteraceae bacterium]|nr:hypothetical protein [Solirubrobacteraceae bacterium]